MYIIINQIRLPILHLDFSVHFNAEICLVCKTLRSEISANQFWSRLFIHVVVFSFEFQFGWKANCPHQKWDFQYDFGCCHQTGHQALSVHIRAHPTQCACSKWICWKSEKNKILLYVSKKYLFAIDWNHQWCKANNVGLQIQVQSSSRCRHKSSHRLLHLVGPHRKDSAVQFLLAGFRFNSDKQQSFNF